MARSFPRLEAGGPSSRKQRKLLAEETLEIIKTGQYNTVEGKCVVISDLVATSADGSRVFSPERLVKLSQQVPLTFLQSENSTRFEVTNETTLTAARRLVVNEGLSDVLVLNFASGKNPGGGFLNGSNAQEESLALCSSLYHNQVQRGQSYYSANRAAKAPFYTHNMLWSPQVPVFRDDVTHSLLPQPFMVDIVTAPAVNAEWARKSGKATHDQVQDRQLERIDRFFSLASHQGSRTLVLGAWGCGVFGHAPEDMAEMFRGLLEGKFKDAFRRIVFAIYHGNDSRNFDAFASLFSPTSLKSDDEEAKVTFETV